MITWLTARRQARRRRREIGLALRGEFELERPRGLARLTALARDVGELERARMTAHARALQQRPPRPSLAPRTATRRY